MKTLNHCVHRGCHKSNWSTQSKNRGGEKSEQTAERRRRSIVSGSPLGAREGLKFKTLAEFVASVAELMHSQHRRH